jgi:hypothetical protein
MKKGIIISLLLVCMNLFAQETKPWLFIGIYRSATGDCADWILVREEINDMNEYKLRSQRFYDDHKGFSPRPDYISEKHCVIICEFKTKKYNSKCFPKGYKIFKAYSIKDCKRAMEQDTKLYKNDRSVQPFPLYERQAIGGKQK